MFARLVAPQLRARSATLLSLAALSQANGLQLVSKRLGVPAVSRMQGVRMMCTDIPGYATTYTILKPGAGTAVEKGATVTVHATGVVKESGKQFWSTKDPGQEPFTYIAGVGQVIVGWDQGLLGMQVGEERRVTIPADEGYGPQGFPAWGIPAGGTLEFELEVLSIG